MPPSRRKVVRSPHRSRKYFVHEFVDNVYGNPHESGPQAFGSPYSSLLPTSTKISINADQT